MTTNPHSFILAHIMMVFVLIALFTGKSCDRNGSSFDKSPFFYSFSTGLQAALAVLIYTWNLLHLESRQQLLQSYISANLGLASSSAEQAAMGIIYITTTLTMAVLIYGMRSMLSGLMPAENRIR